MTYQNNDKNLILQIKKSFENSNHLVNMDDYENENNILMLFRNQSMYYKQKITGRPLNDKIIGSKFLFY